MVTMLAEVPESRNSLVGSPTLSGGASACCCALWLVARTSPGVLKPAAALPGRLPGPARRCLSLLLRPLVGVPHAAPFLRLLRHGLLRVIRERCLAH